ncbi:MFS transporter [Actinomadura alba]|uniref:MFS transporter n=1 Tax=Actinomadura alba TaxID=406431 RepID=A0ABR7LTG9_9ACTN|nr:MFS transporter [Actinomadura alba]
MATLIAAGAASSCGVPLLPIHVTTTAGGTLSQVGYISTTSLLGSLVGLILGHISDRRKSNTGIIRISALLLSFGWFAVGWTRSVLEVFLISICFLSLATVLSSQVFAAISTSQESKERERAKVASSLRACFSLGYAIGPLVGAAIAGIGGIRAAFSVSGLLYFSIVLIAKSPAPSNLEEVRKVSSPGGVAPSSLGRMVFFCSLLCLVLVGDFLKASYLPVYIVHNLGYSILVSGVLLGLCAGLELIAFMVIGLISSRYGAGWTVAIAVGIASLGYSLMAGIPHLAVIYMVQISHVWVFAAIHGVGPIYTQRLLGPHIGTATASFFFAVAGAKVLSGVIGGVLAVPLGLPNLFWLPAAICAIVFIVMIFTVPRGVLRVQ